MKKNKTSTPVAVLAPEAQGWKLTLPTGETHVGQNLEEATAMLQPAQALHLELPCHAAVFERMTLPSIDRDELAGMVELQLEKTLPYPLEEVSRGFEIISQTENESTIVAVAANTEQLERLCEPLRKRACLPEKVTVQAQHVTAQCPDEGSFLCLWPEEGQLVVAVCEQGKLSFATSLPSTEAEPLLTELPAFLLNADMAGVPTDFAGLRLAPACGGLRDQLAEYFGKPVEVASFDGSIADSGINLVPGSWGIERRRVEQSANLKQRLQVVAAAYLLLVAGAFMYLAWQKRQVRQLEVQIARTQPLVESSAAQQTRWRILVPAVDPGRFLVELTHLFYESRPSSNVKFTLIRVDAKGWQLKGQAPVDAVYQFTSKLKAEPGLQPFTLNTPQPRIGENEEAEFEISGTPL
ncbi:MAG: hypothetical protein ABI680_02965 [Chthoniobacteraceae bacterium]